METDDWCVLATVNLADATKLKEALEFNQRLINDGGAEERVLDRDLRAR